MEDQHEIKNKMILTSLFSVVGIVVVVGSIMYVAQKKLPVKYTKYKNQEQIPTTAPVTGTMILTPKAKATLYHKGDTVTFVITADSRGDKITGYDTVLRYDPTLIAFSKATSLVEGVDLYQTDQPAEGEGKNDLIVTGIQSISQKDPFLFTNTPLAEVTFVIKQTGTIAIDMIFMPGHTADSNLMNVQTQDILSSAQGATLESK